MRRFQGVGEVGGFVERPDPLDGLGPQLLVVLIEVAQAPTTSSDLVDRPVFLGEFGLRRFQGVGEVGGFVERPDPLDDSCSWCSSR